MKEAAGFRRSSPATSIMKRSLEVVMLHKDEGSHSYGVIKRAEAVMLNEGLIVRIKIYSHIRCSIYNCETLILAYKVRYDKGNFRQSGAHYYLD